MSSSSDRRIATLAEQMRWMHTCGDPECDGLHGCQPCAPAVGAVGAAGDDHAALEEGSELNLDYEKLSKVAATESSVVPCCVQHVDTKEVLIIAYVNDEALAKSRETKIATFWSTSRNELWVKGLTSGDYLDLLEIRVNCEQNSLLYMVRPAKGGVCHTKDPASGKTRMTCYYRTLKDDGTMEILPEASQ